MRDKKEEIRVIGNGITWGQVVHLSRQTRL